MSISLGSAEGEIILKSDGVSRGVATAVRALRSFESQTAGAGKNLDQLGASGERAGNQVASGAGRATQSIRELAQSSADVSGSFDKLGNAAGLVGGALVAGLGLAVKSASDLQTELAAVSTIAPDVNLDQIGNAVEEMSIRVGKSQTDLAATLYNIFGSVAASQSEALALTEQFSKQAIANRTDVETFGASVLGVLNAMNLGLDQSAHVGDIFTKTIQDGVISGTQLASVLGNVSQSANAAGVDIDELGALIAGVTKAGGDAGQRVNDLNNLLQKLVTKDVQEGLADLGVATKNADGSFRDILGVLRDLDTALGNLSQSQRAEALQKIFPDAQARTGLTAVLGQLDSITLAAQENATAVGVADAAYNKMAGTAAQSAARLKATLFASLIDAGNIALPNIVGLAERVRDLVGAFSELPPGMQSAIVNGVALTAGLTLIGSGAIKAATTIIQLATAARTAAAAITTLAGGGAALVAILGGVGVALGSAEIALRVISGNRLNLIDLTKSLLQYGDALAKGREGAATFFATHKDDTEALKAQRQELEAQLVALRAIDAQFADFSLPALKDLFTGKSVGRAVDIGNILKEIEALQQLQDAQDRQAANEQRLAELKRQGKSPDFTGPVLPFVGPVLPPGAATEFTDFHLAVARVVASGQEVAPTFKQVYDLVQQTGGAAGNTSTEVDTLSASYFANADAASRMARASEVAANQVALLQGLQDRLAGLQAQAQGVTSAVQPMQAAFDLLNQKVAAGIPLTNEQAHLLATLPGYIAATTSGYDNLITNTAQAAIAIENANKAAQGGGAGFPTLGGQASALQAALDDLRTSAIELEGALGALGTQNSKLGGEYNILNDRVQALNDKKKENKGLSADEAAELATLQGALDKLGGAMGENAAKQRALILQLLGLDDQTKSTTGALANVTNALGQIAPPAGQGANALVGLDDGFGNIATAAGRAFTPVQGITNAINGLPTNKTVNVSFNIGEGAQAAAAGLEKLAGKGGAGGAQTITVTANTSAADTALANIRTALATIQATKTSPEINAVDNASPIAATVTTNVKAIPEIHATELNAVDNASGIIGQVRDAINNLPTTFSITANVNIGGALSQIQTLRDNMPSSPAKEGPFRTLPDWSSVFSGLREAGDEAVDTTQTTVQRLAAAIDSGMSEAEATAAKSAAELAQSIASAVAAIGDALATLRSFRQPDPSLFGRFRESFLPIVAAFAEDAAATGADASKAAGEWADNASKIFGSVSAGADALAKLRDFVRPADKALREFRDASRLLVALMLEIAADSDAGLTEAGAQWAEAASTIYQSVGTGVDALTKLRDFRRPSDRAATDFRDISQFVVNLIAAVAADIEDQALPKARDWADTASAIFGALSSGVDALTKLHDFQRPTDAAVESFRDVSQYAVNLIAQVAADIEAQALPSAKAWADTAVSIFAALSSGVDALTKLRDFERPADAALRSLVDVTQLAVNLIAEVAALTDAQMVADAAVYAEAAGKVLSLIGAGVSTLGQLGGEEFRPPDRGTLDRIAQSTREAVVAVAAAASTVESELVGEAATYSDGASKAVALIGSGFSAFSQISGFVAPSQQQIDQLVAVTVLTVRRLAEAAKGMDQEAVKAAGEFGESGGKAIGIVGATLSAFGNMKDFVAPSKEGIDEVLSVTTYAAQRLGEIAQGFDPATLRKLADFGDGVSSGLSAVRAALDLGKTFQDEDRIKPADAIGTALSEFQAGLGPLGQLLTLSEQYKTEGAQIGANIAQAYAAIAGSLPGFTPQSQAASVTVNAGQQVVVHRFEGAISFQFLGENGQWIVKSLTVDDAALTQTSDLIAGKLAPIFEEALAQA